MIAAFPRDAAQGLLLASAIESDCAYFEMGAERRQLDGAVMAWMPGLTRSPAAAVIHRVEPEAIAEGGSEWIGRAEEAMAEVGAALSRIYLDRRHEPAESTLRAAGYAARDELVFVGGLAETPHDLLLRPVESEADWERKLRLHEAADETPDGHSTRAADWVAIERRKCDAGMQAYLAEIEGEAVGAIGAFPCGSLLRAKNLVVAPDRRRHGIARAIVGGLAALGRQRGLPQQCFLAVRGEQGEQLYRAMGMAMIGQQVEWSRPLAGAAR